MHWRCDQDEQRWIKNITYFMNAVRNTGVPESLVPGRTDRHEEKSGDFRIHYICMLRGTVQVNVPEFPRPEMINPRTTPEGVSPIIGLIALDPLRLVHLCDILWNSCIRPQLMHGIHEVLILHLQ